MSSSSNMITNASGTGRISSAKSRLTGERPQQGVTPDSLLALHEAGYRAVLERIGRGRILDVGCGQGFESARFLGPGRQVVGVDYSSEALAAAAERYGDEGLRVAQMDALALGVREACFDAVCSSHLIEHFSDPEPHVAELARVLSDDGVACVLTPNAPADFENPFHLHLFDRDELRAMLERHFADVWLGGVDATPAVKADFAARREKARKLLRIDAFDLRHRIPHAWYVWAYTRLLPLAYTLVARQDSGGATGITADDWFVTEDLDDTTLVLFATARAPRREGTARAPRREGTARAPRREGTARAPRLDGSADSSRREGRSAMLAVGLTGGIGSGKSSVAELLVEHGAVLIDADQVARDVVAPGGAAYQALIDRFGEDIVTAEGTIDRKALAAIAFTDEESRLALNAITHPAIGAAMIEARDARAGSEDIVVLAIPLLTAAHRETVKLHKVVVVDCPTDVALERLLTQRGFDRADAEARIAAQISRQERLEEADYVLDNSSDRKALRHEVDKLWTWLRAAQEERRQHA